jgi:hypothetical protein
MGEKMTNKEVQVSNKEVQVSIDECDVEDGKITYITLAGMLYSQSA